MKNKIIVPTILFVIALAFSSVALWQAKDKSQADKNEPDNQIILFYGEGCPHCKIVDDYIAENKIEEKVSFVRKEIYNDYDNQKILVEKAKICNIATDSIGVPFLWDGEKCLVGDQSIINFFKTKTNGQQ
ncbi:MAG: hypothetical protein AAB361_01355 [Patescibacteria group bacterium]